MNKSINYYTKTELLFDANAADTDPYFNEMNKWSYCGKILIHKENYKYLIECDTCKTFFFNNCSFLIHLRETHSNIFHLKENDSNQTINKSSLEESMNFISKLLNKNELDNENELDDGNELDGENELGDDSNNNSENSICNTTPDKEVFSPCSLNKIQTNKTRFRSTTSRKLLQKYIKSDLVNKKRAAGTKEISSRGLPKFIRINGIIKCPDCALEFKKKHIIKQHYWLKHTYQFKLENEKDVPILPTNTPNPDDNYYHCTGCLARYKEYKTLMYHFKNHPGASNIENRPHKCTECTSSFWTKTFLERHQLLHTGNLKYKCHICSRSFLRKENLRSHLRHHTNIKPYKCNFCDKSFFEKCVRKYHESAVHLNCKPHTCDICGLSYTKRAFLALHMRRHTGEKPAVCEICNKAFYDNKLLRDHVRIHKEKQFGCKICQRLFARKTQLQNHMKIHSEIYQYVCKFCKQGFKQSAGLYGHIKMVHKNDGGILLDG